MFMVTGVRLISNRVVTEAQEKVRNDLNAAREIYLGKLTNINDVVTLTARRFFLQDAILTRDFDQAMIELIKIKEEFDLDVLTVTDEEGNVILRTSNLTETGDNQCHDLLVEKAILELKPVYSTIIVCGGDLEKESPVLAKQAYFKFIDTPLARKRSETEETGGMMLKSVAPILDSEHNLIGVLYGAILLNRNFEIVDKVKQTVFQDVHYKGKDIGTATIFQDDVRITTNVENEDRSRAIGTRVSEDVYKRVVMEGEPWIDRAYVVNNWYITAYEPIRDISDKIIGILYVGILEEKYVDIQTQTILSFSAITFIGAMIAMIAAYTISKFISVPIGKMVSASKEIAVGNLDVRVDINTNDELEYLADSLNAMAEALRKREEKLREFTTQKIMESERLALIGQLAANVAHELNNPLQGIVTYSHLLLESDARVEPTKAYVEKIVAQANRSRDIIRGLLDFSRQRTPDKTLCNVNSILQECLSLLENQALFLNIYIVRNFQTDLPLIVIDPSQIERVFMNIIINAAEAMDGMGKLFITTKYNQMIDSIEIILADSGQGIKEEHLVEIFDPFFTTKEVGHGTGLGLAISYGIVKGHYGNIWVESEVGVGTTFHIELPVHVEEKVVGDE